MPGCLRGCIGKAVLLVLLVAAGVAVWTWGPELYPPLGNLLGERGGEEPTPELAEEALDRFEDFRAGEPDERMALSATEITSVLRFALPGILPDGVTDPRVRIEDGRIRVHARVARDALPRIPALGPALGALPDTVPFAADATLVPREGGGAVLVVHSVEISRIPVPDRFIPEILGALGRTERSGVPDDAFPVPLPSGVRSAFLERDSLVLVAER